MKYKLLVSIDGYWKQLNASNDYENIKRIAKELHDDIEWMIVEIKLHHS